MKIIDWKLALQRAGNKRDLAEDILALLIKNLPMDLEKICKAYQEQNYPELLHLVHKLHGALCYSGAQRLKTVVAHLETQLKNPIMDDLPNQIELLTTEANLLLECCTHPIVKPQGLS